MTDSGNIDISDETFDSFFGLIFSIVLYNVVNLYSQGIRYSTFYESLEAYYNFIILFPTILFAIASCCACFIKPEFGCIGFILGFVVWVLLSLYSMYILNIVNVLYEFDVTYHIVLTTIIQVICVILLIVGYTQYSKLNNKEKRYENVYRSLRTTTFLVFLTIESNIILDMHSTKNEALGERVLFVLALYIFITLLFHLFYLPLSTKKYITISNILASISFFIIILNTRMYAMSRTEYYVWPLGLNVLLNLISIVISIYMTGDTILKPDNNLTFNLGNRPRPPGPTTISRPMTVEEIERRLGDLTVPTTVPVSNPVTISTNQTPTPNEEDPPSYTEIYKTPA